MRSLLFASCCASTAPDKGDRLKVAAGLTPLEKATIEKETRIGVAEALAKRPVPKIVMNRGGGQSDLVNSIAMENMIVLMNKMK